MRYKIKKSSDNNFDLEFEFSEIQFEEDLEIIQLFVQFMDKIDGFYSAAKAMESEDYKILFKIKGQTLIGSVDSKTISVFHKITYAGKRTFEKALGEVEIPDKIINELELFIAAILILYPFKEHYSILERK